MTRKFIALILIGPLLVLQVIGTHLFHGWLFVGFFVLFTVALMMCLWEALPQSLLRALGAGRNNFLAAGLTSVLCFSFGGAYLNRLWTSSLIAPLSLVGDVVVLSLSFFLGWVFIRKPGRFAFLLGVGIHALFLVLLTHQDSRNHPNVLQPTTSEIENLRALGYVAWVNDDDDAQLLGVTKNQYDPSHEALNIYNHDMHSTAFLIDMTGKVVHSWSDGLSKWHHVEPLSNGDLLGVVQNNSLVRLDWHSNVQWRKERMLFHHDVDVNENGDIYAIAREDAILFHGALPLYIMNDFIAILRSDGTVRERISLFGVLESLIPPMDTSDVWDMWKHAFSFKEYLSTLGGRLLLTPNHAAHDLFHTNSVELIDRDIEGLCTKGDLLICIRNLDLIAILDVNTNELIWSWGPGELERPHAPTMLDSGNILVFDNGSSREYSRVLELNPRTKIIEWEYSTEPPCEFYSATRGSCQRLPNGNTLIAESNRGRVFEVTLDGEVVWEFFSSATIEASGGKQKRLAIYRFMRIVNEETIPRMESTQEAVLSSRMKEVDTNSEMPD